MSETVIQNSSPNEWADMFGEMGGSTKPVIKFGGGNDGDIPDLSAVKKVEPPPVTGTEGDGGAPAEGVKKEEEIIEVDLVGDGKPAIQPTGISDLSKYYEDRIKNGMFIAVETEDETGKKIPFIPKTAEEYDEVLELQVNYKLAEAMKAKEKSWYDSKSPAWKVVSQYAELVDDPSHLIPFLQGVKTLQSVAQLDDNEINGAEQIVRTRLAQRGDPEEIINQQIETLKTTDTLLKTAKAYKPIIMQQEQQALAAQMKAEEERDRQYKALITDIRDSAIKEIEKPLFGKTKLKQEEKAIIYDLIGEPAEETQGYAIYNMLDQLFEKKDFAKLTEVALLLGKREAFFNYLGSNVANATAASLEKKLRLAGEARTSSGNDYDEGEVRPTITRNQFNKKPTFGRG